jgi:hypothetical protein
MTMLPSDPIRNKSRGTAQEAIAALDRPDAKDKAYLETIYDRAPDLGLDASILVSQAYEETSGLTSARWINDSQPSGIGIVFDNTQQPFPIPTPQAAAIIHLEVLNQLVVDTVPAWYTPGEIPQQALSWINRVWIPHCFAGPNVRVIDDLNIHFEVPGDVESTFAWDPMYQDNICEWGNKVFPNLPDAAVASGVTKFKKGPRSFTLIQGANLRTGPSRDFAIRKAILKPTAMKFIGTTVGQFVSGSSIWLVAGAANKYLVVHSSGVREAI